MSALTKPNERIHENKSCRPNLSNLDFDSIKSPDFVFSAWAAVQTPNFFAFPLWSRALREAQSPRPAVVSHLGSKHVQETSPSFQSRLESAGKAAASPAVQHLFKRHRGPSDRLRSTKIEASRKPSFNLKESSRPVDFAADSLLAVQRQGPSSSLAALKTQSSCSSEEMRTARPCGP